MFKLFQESGRQTLNRPVVGEKMTKYLEELPKYGVLITVTEYLKYVATECLVDYDGAGHPVKNKKMADIEIRPSHKGKDIPKDATHIMWFNK